jgi:hypothetical protein
MSDFVADPFVAPVQSFDSNKRIKQSLISRRNRVKKKISVYSAKGFPKIKL